MDIDFCFNRRIIGNIGTDTFDYLISNEVVRLFTLPNHEKTSVHNRDNWLYDLKEHPIDPPSPPTTPPKYECVNDPIHKEESGPETPPNYYNIAELVPPSCVDNHVMLITRLNTFQDDITIVKEEIKLIRFDVLGLMDIAVEQSFIIWTKLLLHWDKNVAETTDHWFLPLALSNEDTALFCMGREYFYLLHYFCSIVFIFYIIATFLSYVTFNFNSLIQLLFNYAYFIFLFISTFMLLNSKCLAIIYAAILLCWDFFWI